MDALRYLDFIQLVMHIDAYCPANGGCTVHKPTGYPRVMVVTA